MSDLNKKNIIIVTMLVLVVGGGGFFAGSAYQKSKAQRIADNNDEGMRGRNAFSDHQRNIGGGIMGSGQMVAGEVINKDEESITLKIQDGGSKIVFVSEETSVRKAEEGSLDDLSEGIQVMVFGSENPDGSVSANNIQLNPGFAESFNRSHQAD